MSTSLQIEHGIFSFSTTHKKTFKFETYIKILRRITIIKDEEDQVYACAFRGQGMPPPRSDPTCLPPVGWMASEKFDGYRGLWCGEEREFYSRAGKMFNSPELYKKAFPKEDLDGEYAGRRSTRLQYMGVVSRKEIPIDDDWAGHIKYVVYDLPNHPGTFEERLKSLRNSKRLRQVKWKKISKVMPKPYRNIQCPL